MPNVIIEISDVRVIHHGLINHVDGDSGLLRARCAFCGRDDDFFDFGCSERRGAGGDRHHGSIEFFQSEHREPLI